MKKNNLIIVLGVITVVVGLIGVTISNKQEKSTKQETQKEEEVAVIPTIDTSVTVDLKAKNNNKAVELSIRSIPSGTDSIEYELSYQTKQQGVQGIIGTLQIEDGKKDYTITRDLGTCSSGTCIFHEIDGDIAVKLKFIGSYGEKIFDREYEI